MRIDQFLIGILCISVIIVAGVLVWGNTIDNYDLNTTTTSEGANFSGVYDTIDATYNLSQDMKSQTLEGEIEGADESWESMAKGSYGAVRLVKNSFALIGDILDAIARQVGIPSFFIKAAMTAISILVIFAIIYLVFRFKG